MNINSEGHNFIKGGFNESKRKIIISCLMVVIIILFVAISLLMSDAPANEINSTNNTTNSTPQVVNATLVEDSGDSSSQESSSYGNEPEYGTDEYVDRWDQSQQSNDDWAYLHDQPVKTENGHEYKRMYDQDTGESYWYQMDQDFDFDE